MRVFIDVVRPGGKLPNEHRRIAGERVRSLTGKAHASRIAAPVLLFHGDRDLNVLVGHSRRMHDALRDAGRQSELVVFPHLEHDLADGDARQQMLARIRNFLASRLGQSADTH